jgi:photosystem II stability/assembly factor-like uncharacterized protein
MRTSVFALLLLACAACTHAQREPADLGEARSRYFVERRAFPFAAIPDGARREALEAWRRTRRAVSESVGSWRPVGGGSIDVKPPYRRANGRINAIAISPADPNVILIGASTGGILRSVDGGASFVPVADDQADFSVGDIAFANANIVYAGMGDPIIDITLGSGVLRSDDAGATWRHVSSGQLIERGAIRQVVIDPDDPEHVLILQRLHVNPNGSPGAGGILESRDGGGTWTSLMFGVFNSLVRIDATTLVAGLPGRILRSTDGGTHWSSVISRLGEVFVARAPFDSSLVYATSTGDSDVQLLVSHDGGATWQTSTAQGLEADKSPFNYFAVSPSDSHTLYRGMRDLWRSTDGGGHWTNLTMNWTGDSFNASHATMHTDQHAIAFSSDGTTWLATDGGLYMSRDGTQTFAFAGPGDMSVIQLYAITGHPLDGSRLYGGTQDNGMEMSTGGGQWSETATGDYGTIIFDPRNSQRFLSNYVQGEFFLFNSNGLATSRVTTNDTFGEIEKSPRIEFIAPLVMNRSAYALYFASWRLFVSHDFGSTWSPTAGITDLTRGVSDYVSAIGITEAAANVIYTGSAQGRVMRSSDGGATWNDITADLPQRAISSIVPSGDGATAWIAFSGYHAGHIYRTTDGGVTWSRIDAGLPDLPVDTLFLDGTTLWAGTDAGAFRLGDDGWDQIGSGMPPVIVTAFARTADGRLLAATHGRGVYEFVPPAPAPQRRRSAPH